MDRVQIKQQNKLLLLLSIVAGMVGCAPIPSFTMKNSVTFAIHGQNKSYIYKNTWPKCANFDIDLGLKYNDLSDSCKVSPEGYVPEEIVIEYAPWLTYGQQVEIGLGNSRTAFDLDHLAFEQRPSDEVLIAYDTKIEKKVELAIDKLPPTVWKKIVLHPAELVSKYRFKTPEGNGNRLRGKEIHYIITLNPDGSYKVEDKLYWVSPYSKNWN